MGIHHRKFSEVPLDALFPRLSPAGIEQMTAAAAVVDEVRPSADGPGWDFYPEHLDTPIQPGFAVQLLTTTISAPHDGNDDWLEFSLDVSWSRPTTLAIAVDVGVACWCPTDHGTHYVLDIKRETGPGDALAFAFTQAANDLARRWRDDPHNPSTQRLAAGLPDRPPHAL
jgi:hypothetical protein